MKKSLFDTLRGYRGDSDGRQLRVAELLSVAQHEPKGNGAAEVNLDGVDDTDPLLPLARAVNTLTAQLYKRNQQVHKLANHVNRELEGQVAKRTAFLRNSDQRHSAIINSALDAIISIDRDGLVSAWNPAAERVFGYSSDEAIGQSLADLIIPSPKRAAHRKGMREYFASGDRSLMGRQLSVNAQTRDGHGLKVELYIEFTGTDEFPEFTGFIRDVTQRHEAEELLLQSNARFQLLSESMAVSVLTVNEDNSIGYANSFAQKYFGRTLERLQPRFWPEFIHHEDLPLLLDSFTGLFRDKRRTALEFRACGPSGTDYRWLSLIGVPVALSDSEGPKMGAIASLVDVDDIKRAQSEAEAATASKSAFLSAMSHEIRTPMNAIIGMTGLLLETTQSNEQREFTEIIRHSGDHLLGVINDILDYSKIEAGRMELENAAFSIRSCIEESLDLLSLPAAEKRQELEYLIETDTPEMISGDIGRFRQVLVNLLSNAVKFTPDDGRVTVTVRRELHHAEPEALHIEVADSGIGIPQDRMDRLFKPFSQVDVTTSRQFGGTGLGLAISSRLVELMKGRMWVDSELGVGSVFHFTMHATPADSPPVAELIDNDTLRGHSLLIVDDNPDARRITAHYANRWGMKVRTAGDGESALRAFEEEIPEVALIDFRMPDMNGGDLASELAARHGYAVPPMILFTAVGIGQRDLGGQMAAFQSHMPKPIKPQVMFRVLASTLGLRARTAETDRPRFSLDPKMGERHPLRILLAEDNQVNRKVATLVLDKLGYGVNVAGNGLEAIQEVKRLPYDLVLMDVQMPEMDGLEATRLIREHFGDGPRPSIVAMTAEVSTLTVHDCMKAGMDDFLAKPFDSKLLVEVLKRCKQVDWADTSRSN